MKNYQKLGVFSHSSRNQKSKTKVLAGPNFLRRFYGRIHYLTFPAFGTSRGFLASGQISPTSTFMVTSTHHLSQTSLCHALIQVIAFRVHTDNPRLPKDLMFLNLTTYFAIESNSYRLQGLGHKYIL